MLLLQMASHAIGDLEALLEASGISDKDENGATGFDERIRQLVIAALAGKDVEAATRQAERSIADAKSALEREEESINAMLGGMDGADVRRTSRPDPAGRRAIYGAARIHAGGIKEFGSAYHASTGGPVSRGRKRLSRIHPF